MHHLIDLQITHPSTTESTTEDMNQSIEVRGKGEGKRSKAVPSLTEVLLCGLELSAHPPSASRRGEAIVVRRAEERRERRVSSGGGKWSEEP